jgi:hypothetical protein
MGTAELPRSIGPRRRWSAAVGGLTAWRAADAWLFAPGSARRLAAVRIGLCAVLAARLGRGIFGDLAGQPRALYRPVSFMHLLGGMPGRGVVVALQVAGIAAAILAMVGLRARLALPVAWGCALVLNGMVTSAGKVVHNDVLLLLALLPLLFAPVSDRWSVDSLIARRGGRAPAPYLSYRYGWPTRASLALIAAVYSLIGLNKLILSGPAWVLSDNMRWILYASSDARRSPNALAIFIADRPLLAHLVAAAPLGLELGFPLVLWFRRARPLLVGGVIALHLGIMVAMGLDYTPWILTDLVVFVDWPRLLDRVRGRPAVPVPAAEVAAP